MEPYQELEKRIKEFRVRCRNNSKRVTSTLIDDHQSKLCVFCGEVNSLTKEHVVPKWTFEGCPKRDFLTQSNNQPHTYNKTTVLACQKCNNFNLGYLENYIKRILTETDIEEEEFFYGEDLENIVRWLEIIDYKFQVFNIQKKFIRHKGSEYIEFLKDYPIAMFRSGHDTPSKVFTEYRRAHRRLSIKSKVSNLNSLLVFKTKNPAFSFAHTVNEFIFFDLPKQGLAIFYFYSKEFKSANDAHKEAMKWLKKIYPGPKKKLDLEP